MIVVTILGGMGNQLRSYAGAYAVSNYLKQPFVLDVADYFGGYFRPYVLDRLNIPDHLKLYYPHKTPVYCCPYGAPLNFQERFDIINVDNMKDRRELLDAVKGKENIWLIGYGKLSFCTEEEKSELKELFWPIVKSKCQMNFIHKTAQEESVAVHIRRTDFIDNGWIGNETLQYYQAAISYLAKQLDKPEFYFFSDDIEWAKGTLGYQENYHYVRCMNGMESDIEELFFMASCKHHILTNQSTFGAWAVILSPYTDGITIINGDELNLSGCYVMDGLMPEHCLVMDRPMIRQWCREYEAEYEIWEDRIPWNELETALEENDNKTVIDFVDDLSLNIYGVLPKAQERLMELKGIAHIQNNDMETALSVFDCLQQSQRDSFDFSFNYSIALNMAGHRLESLMYLGNALRLNETGVPYELLETENSYEENIIKLTREQRKRHYVILTLPYGHSKSIKGYYEGIAIMLRNLGNKVTIAELLDTQTFMGEWNRDSKKAILNRILGTAEKQDKVYNWDICKYQICAVEVNSRQMLSIADMIPCLTGEEEEVVLITHSMEGVRNAADRYPLIFLDAVSEWDNQKGITASYKDKEWDEIYQRADKVITEKEPPFRWRGKKVSPFECPHKTDANEICFQEERITELNHYMRNEEMLCGVLSVLKAAEKAMEKI